MKFFSKFVLPSLLFLIAGFSSCQSFPFSFTEERSWPTGKAIQTVATVRIINIEVEKSGGWISLEEEIGGMIPLIFGESGYAFIPGTSGADYAVDVHVREREYTKGWETKISLSLELRLWPDAGADEKNYRGTPLAAAQILSTGNDSFSSSKQLNRMLRKAVKKIIKTLEKKKNE
ncbi:hypothetical protein FACS1894147_05330 [Spirochaetia bacterium]|nr:hypothetical protein FACS1894147_05330 [Spirochaetia bacterium]